MSMKKQYLLFLIVLVIVLIDRYFWSGLTTWREDEATVMWMAEYISQEDLIYGLLNSRHVPNPNGMPLFSKIFAPLDSLRWVSFSLQLFTLCSVLVFSKVVSKKNWLALFTMLSSLIVIRNNCGDLWAQSILLPLNFFIASLLLLYPKFRNWTIISITALVALIPFTFYLAGIPIVMAAALTTLISLFIFPPKIDRKDIITASLIFISGLGLIIYFVWVPYFSNVDMELLTSQSRPTLIVGQGYRFLEQIILLPFSLVFRVMGNDFTARTFFSPEIYPKWTSTLGVVYQYFFKAQALIWGVVLIKVVFTFLKTYTPKFKLDYFFTFREQIRKLNVEDLNYTIVLVFIAFCGGFTPAMGGFRWTSGARLDLLIPFVPFFCYFIFFKFNKWLTKFTIPLFTAFNFIAGFYFLYFQYNYKGDVITGADVSIVHKEKLIDYIAEDWKRNGNGGPIPAHFDMAGPHWGFIPSITKKYDKRFNNSYTLGRSMDYMLKKRHNLDNLFEGKVRESTPQGAKYIINYTYQKPVAGLLKEIRFNRLRLNIMN